LVEFGIDNEAIDEEDGMVEEDDTAAVAAADGEGVTTAEAGRVLELCKRAEPFEAGGLLCRSAPACELLLTL
jgi:hypothetical protein